jgi:cytochrome c
LVEVADAEDGTPGAGIKPADVHTTLLFEPAGLATLPAGGPGPGVDGVAGSGSPAEEQAYGGRALIERSDCAACHAVDRKINGPAYRDIAARYSENDLAYLARKVIAGGSGVWGEIAMSAHPQLDPDDVELMIRYVLSTGDTTPASNVATSGSTVVDASQLNIGRVIFSVTYTDRGASGVSGIEQSDRIVLVPPHFEAEALPLRSEGATVYDADGATLVGELGDGAYLGMRGVDLTDIRLVELGLYFVADHNYRGTIELRIGSPDGEMAGSTNIRHQQSTAARVTRSIPLDVPDRDTPRDVYVVFRTSPTDRFVANVDWVGFRS